MCVCVCLQCFARSQFLWLKNVRIFIIGHTIINFFFFLSENALYCAHVRHRARVCVCVFTFVPRNTNALIMRDNNFCSINARYIQFLRCINFIQTYCEIFILMCAWAFIYKSGSAKSESERAKWLRLTICCFFFARLSRFARMRLFTII